MKKRIYTILIIFFCAVFLVSAGFLADYYIKSKKQKDKYDNLANIVQQVQQEQAPPAEEDNLDINGVILPPLPQNQYTIVNHPETGEAIRMLREYAPIFEMNTDLVGWIRVDGTTVNYPVLQSVDRPNFYLKRDFYKEDSRHGCIYASEMVDIDAPSDNITLYGHNMSDGSMFASLHNYNDKKFFDEHAFITFDTLYEHHTYQIISVFYTTDFVDTGFAYHLFSDGNEEAFNEFVAKCKELALYDTGNTAVYGDKLITLSTCDKNYADDHGRFVVVAKKMV